MSIKGQYVNRTEMLRAAKMCFYREAPVINTLYETIVGKSEPQLRAEEIINAAFDSREFREIPFIAIEDEFRRRSEHELINALIEHMESESM